MLTANVSLPDHVYGATAQMHCCEMSRYISQPLQGNSPALGAWGAELPLVSATVVVGVDRSRDRQTYVPSKIQEGESLIVFKEAIISAVHRHPLLLFEESLFCGFSFGSQFKLSQWDYWNHVWWSSHTFFTPLHRIHEQATHEIRKKLKENR